MAHFTRKEIEKAKRRNQEHAAEVAQIAVKTRAEQEMWLRAAFSKLGVDTSDRNGAWRTLYKVVTDNFDYGPDGHSHVSTLCHADTGEQVEGIEPLMLRLEYKGRLLT